MIRRIRRSELNGLAGEWGFTFDESELDQFHTLTEYLADSTEGVEKLPAPEPFNLPATREPGRRSTSEDDPYNAIVRWCSVKAGGAEGALSGVRLGLKESIAVAGVPLTAGSNVLRHYVPTVDSVLTRRVLDAGAEIVAMTNMDNLAFSGGGDTSAYGSTRCPFDVARTAGGSSGGSGAALYYDDVDITVGCDQGGSIRVPGAWSGVIGLKPTHGLVPYVGIMGIDHPIDHAGPMARSAGDAARLLQAIAGKHDADPRQPADVPQRDYVRAVAEAPEDLRGLRIGVVVEGMGDELGVTDATRDAVRAALERFGELGAEVTEVSIPEHLLGGPVAFVGIVEGMTALMTGGGNGYHWRGSYSPELAHAVAAGLQAFGDELSPQVKLTLVCGAHMRKEYRGALYAQAQNLHPWLRAAYDRALADVDMLVMPTTPGQPHVDDPELDIAEHVMRGWAVLGNTVTTDVTGHPAMTLPAAEADGLPVGVMVIGRHFEDDRLLGLAGTFEQRFGWAPDHPGDPRRVSTATR